MAASQSGGGPRKFFKVLLPGSFEISLSLPPKFAAGLGGVLSPWRGAAAKLRDRTGKSWDVDLHRDTAHRVCFTGGGWRGFVSDKSVSAGQLLVFEHRGGFDFAVERFDASGCCCEEQARGGSSNKVVDQRMTAATGTEAAADKEPGNSRRRQEAAPLAPPCTGGVKRRRQSPSTATTAGDDNETLCCRIERPYQLRLLDLSKSFCDRVGWTSSRDVVLCAAGAGGSSSRKEEEKRWQVSVKVSAKNAIMCGGWTEFAQDNGLAVSDACVFVPLPGSGSNVLQVHLLRGNRRPL